jgi:hypothetical protein
MRARRTIGVLLLWTALWGCASPAPDPLTFRGAPADFTLDVTVQGPQDDRMARARRPGRYVLEPDGILRVGVGEGVSREYYPPQTRQLSRDETDRVWRLVRDSRILEPDNPDRVRPGLPFGRVQDRPTADMSILYAGEREHYRVLLDGQTPESAAVERVVDHLAGLAWLEP